MFARFWLSLALLAVAAPALAGGTMYRCYTADECRDYVKCQCPTAIEPSPCPEPAAEAQAQPAHTVELFAGAGLMRPQLSDFSTGVTWTAGVAIPVLDPSVALQVEYTGAQAGLDGGGQLDLLSLGGGPRIRGDLFGGGLILPHGEFIVSWLQQHRHGVGQSSQTSDHLAVAFGGGVEIAVTDTIALDLAARYLTTVTGGGNLRAIMPGGSLRIGF